MAESNEIKEQSEEEPSIKFRGWKAMPYVIGNETFEKLGTTGTAGNLLVYLTTIFHMKSAYAATLLNVFNGTANFAPLIGAFLSDSYFGRYATLGFASIASFLGMLILTLTASISSLHPSHCEGQQCTGPTAGQFTVLISAFAFLVIGAGGIRPCNLAFGADQFDPKTESGRKGVNSFFNWYYFTYTFAMMISATVIIYVQSDVSWSLGLAIPTLLMFFSCTFFFVGTRIYVRVRPEGSPFTSIAQVLAAAFYKRRLKFSDEKEKDVLYNPSHISCLNSKLPHTDQFRYLDKAAIIQANDLDQNGSVDNPWRLCSVQQVEEVKCLVRILPVWSAGLVFNIAMVQQSNYVVFQVEQSDRSLFGSSFQIPAGSFIIFTMLSLSIWIPIYDRIIIPQLRRFFKNEEGLSLLQRMAIGLILSIITMVTAAVIEDRRRSLALNKPTLGLSSGGGAISSMSSLWMIPQLALIGFAEAFNVIGQIEFYYKQFPENMRSIAGSSFFLSLAVSNYLSGFMVTVVHRITNWLDQDLNSGRLDYFYLTIAGLGVVNFMYFMVCASWYRYKRPEIVAEIGLQASNEITNVV